MSVHTINYQHVAELDNYVRTNNKHEFCMLVLV